MSCIDTVGPLPQVSVVPHAMAEFNTQGRDYQLASLRHPITLSISPSETISGCHGNLFDLSCLWHKVKSLVSCRDLGLDLEIIVFW